MVAGFWQRGRVLLHDERASPWWAGCTSQVGEQEEFTLRDHSFRARAVRADPPGRRANGEQELRCHRCGSKGSRAAGQPKNFRKKDLKRWCWKREGDRSIRQRDYVEHVPVWKQRYPWMGRSSNNEQGTTHPKRQAVEWMSGTASSSSMTAKILTQLQMGSLFFGFVAEQVGGRSIMWGRQSYRWSDLDFAKQTNATELLSTGRSDTRIFRPGMTASKISLE